MANYPGVAAVLVFLSLSLFLFSPDFPPTQHFFATQSIFRDEKMGDAEKGALSRSVCEAKQFRRKACVYASWGIQEKTNENW